MLELTGHGAFLGMAASIRTDASYAPPDFGPILTHGLLDVLLCPPALDWSRLQPWIESCRNRIPLRLQLTVPFTTDAALAARVAEAGIRVVNLVLDDPFQETPRCRNREESEEAVSAMATLAQELDMRGVEANIIGPPFCVLPQEARRFLLNSPQYYRDHQHYMRDSYELALSLYGRSPAVASKLIALRLAPYVSFRNPLDEWLLEWLEVKGRRLLGPLSLFHRLTRHMRWPRNRPRPVRVTEPFYEHVASTLHDNRASHPECARCSLRRICDRETPVFRRRLPGLEVRALPGEVVIAPFHLQSDRTRYHDVVDGDRRKRAQWRHELAREARDTMQREPDRRVEAGDYGITNTFFKPLSSAVRWASITADEKVSTPIDHAVPPVTVAATFGGGLAEFIGFRVGLRTVLVCPMDGYRHEMVLHVDADGRYVLLRDGVPVEPVTFVGAYAPPVRLGSRFPVQLSAWNIDDSIGTQNIAVWRGCASIPQEPARVSFVIVSTMYARRLQATLLSIAHQVPAPSATEVAVAYVPGLDATDDVLRSVALAHPNLRIVRVPFAEQQRNAKGAMINEAVAMAGGEWVVLLDSDVLLPTDFAATVSALPAEVSFAAPDGRKMLDAVTTAKVLLGEVAPWEQWQALLDGPGEHRKEEAEGLPIGYCQIVRRECFAKVQYVEHAHFEGADWDFAAAMREEFGRETRLEGTTVVHLHHGGSQWYGTNRHL